MDIYSVDDQAHKTGNDVERCIADVGEESWDDGLVEELDFVTDGARQLWFVRVGISQTNDIKNVEMDDKNGEDGETLLVVDMTEDARDGLLSF